MLHTWDKTITIYNCHKNGGANGKDVWYRTVLSGCFVKTSNKKIMSENHERISREVIIRIPPDESYVACDAWASLQNKAGRFTFSLYDVVVIGSVSDMIGEGNSELTAAALLALYPENAFRVREFYDNSRNFPAGHYKVVGG